MRAVGPLREALRRKLVLRPRHAHLLYLRCTDTQLATLVADYAEADIRPRIHALGDLAAEQAARALRGAGVPPPPPSTTCCWTPPPPTSSPPAALAASPRPAGA